MGCKADVSELIPVGVQSRCRVADKCRYMGDVYDNAMKRGKPLSMNICRSRPIISQRTVIITTNRTGGEKGCGKNTKSRTFCNLLLSPPPRPRLHTKWKCQDRGYSERSVRNRDCQ